MAILWKKKEKSRNRSDAQGKSPEKGKKRKIDGNYTERPRILPDYPTESRKKEKGGKMQSFPEQETGEAARNEAEPKPEYPISQAAAPSTGGSTGLRKRRPAHLNSTRHLHERACNGDLRSPGRGTDDWGGGAGGIGANQGGEAAPSFDPEARRVG